MLTNIELIQDIGMFQRCDNAPELKQTTLFLGLNGSGKSTLSSLLRSFTNRSYEEIEGRKRFGKKSAKPLIKFTIDQNCTWTFSDKLWVPPALDELPPEILVFDDFFVAKNVFVGLEVANNQRENLLEIVLGEEDGVLARRREEIQKENTANNSAIKTVEKLFDGYRASMPLENFLALPEIDDLKKQITQTKAKIDQVKRADQIKKTPYFSEVSLLPINLDDISAILALSFSELDEDTLCRVQAHFRNLGEESESWTRAGLKFVEDARCPFCGQDIKKNQLLQVYKQYFSDNYRKFLAQINADLDNVLQGLTKTQSLVKQMRNNVPSLHTFWSQDISDLPPVPNFQNFLDASSQIIETLTKVFAQKRQNPLTKINISEELQTLITAYNVVLSSLNQEYEKLTALNKRIIEIKQTSETSSPTALTQELQRLELTKRRYSSQVLELVAQRQTYLEQKARLAQQLETTKDQLAALQESKFARFGTRVNEELRSLGANFQIVNPKTDNQGRPKIIYALKINDTETSLKNFQYALSSGDRRTLALAYFFATLKDDLKKKIVVFDDPFTSLDAKRRDHTINKLSDIRRLCRQLIVLSHNQEFFLKLLEKFKTLKDDVLACIQLTPADGDWSARTMKALDVEELKKNRYDKEHQKLRNYYRNFNAEKPLEVATTLRKVLESYCRVAFVEDFGPGDMLGKNLIQKLTSSLQHPRPKYPITLKQIEELKKLISYANPPHHGTGLEFIEEVDGVNPEALRDFVRKTLEFTGYYPEGAPFKEEN